MGFLSENDIRAGQTRMRLQGGKQNRGIRVR
jgi:hypothetical protein